ncbi:MAG TPA: hypothetical protein PKV93_09380 [Fervidobacterium sp.]|nr:hypothetical protein [Fervidobacterium sp.]
MRQARRESLSVELRNFIYDAPYVTMYGEGKSFDQMYGVWKSV